MCSKVAGWLTPYIASTGNPSTAETISLLRLASHQCGTRSGQTAMASSMATNGRTV